MKVPRLYTWHEFSLNPASTSTLAGIHQVDGHTETDNQNNRLHICKIAI